MNNKLIFCIVLLGTIFVSGCILNSPLENINDIMPEIDKDIASGENYYNEAVIAINSKNYVDADTKANLALKKFNSAHEKVLKTSDYYDGLNQTIFIDYLNLLLEEIELKQNATNYLVLATKKYNENNITAGNSYSQQANSKMNAAFEIQNQRMSIVKNNPDLFY